MWLQIGRTRQASQSQTSRSIKQPKQRWTYGTTVGSSNNKQNTHESRRGSEGPKQKGQDKVKLRIVLIVKATSNTDRGKESWAELEGGQTKIEKHISIWPTERKVQGIKENISKESGTGGKKDLIDRNDVMSQEGELGKMMVGQTTWVVLKPAGSSDERRQNTKLEEYEAQNLALEELTIKIYKKENRRMTEEEVVSPQVIRKKEERINKLKREEDKAVEEVWCKGIEEVINSKEIQIIRVETQEKGRCTDKKREGNDGRTALVNEEWKDKEEQWSLNSQRISQTTRWLKEGAKGRTATNLQFNKSNARWSQTKGNKTLRGKKALTHTGPKGS
ncbi:hypothetical protein BY996DRAFT_8438208 [Phakopsora pachyrhizi]|nr:hypothetical protein BY996DRAFT_8438208 [Phakopsora pachyrhizi]